MLKIPKFCSKLAFLAALIAIFMFLLNIKGKREKAWRLIKSDLIMENAELNHENELLKHKIAGLKNQNLSLKKSSNWPKK